MQYSFIIIYTKSYPPIAFWHNFKAQSILLKNDCFTPSTALNGFARMGACIYYRDTSAHTCKRLFWPQAIFNR